MKKILLYLGDYQEKKTTLETILTTANYSFKFLSDEDLAQPLGYLLGVESYQKAPTQPFPHLGIDFMFLDNLNDDEIMALNQEMKKAGITMPRKAMRTEHNEGWLLYDLLKEIEQEHAYFQDVEAIQKLLVSSSELNINAYTKESWSAYEKAFYQAYETLQKQAEPEKVKQALNSLKQSRAALIDK